MQMCIYTVDSFEQNSAEVVSHLEKVSKQGSKVYSISVHSLG